MISCSRAYNSTKAIERGDIVDLHGKVTNIERLDGFISNVRDKEKDNIRITRYTIEGDPIYYNFTYDGNTIKYKYDNSNDKYGSSNVSTSVCNNFIKTIEGSMIEYKLDGCSGENAEIGKNFSFKLKK